VKKTFAILMVLALSLCAWAAVPTSSSGPALRGPDQSRQQPVVTPAAPMATAWTTIDSITPAASRLTVAACNGKVYRFSGNTSVTSTTVLQEFDPAIGTWTTKNAMPFGIYNAPSATWRDRIVLFSGQQYIGVGTYLMDSIVMYFPDGDSIRSIDGAPYRAGFASSAVIADTLYVFGGTTDYTNGLNTVYACDLSSMTWTAKTVMPAAQYGAAAVAYDGKVYVFGGRNAGTDQAGVMMYSPSADTAGGAPWTAKTAMSTARGGLGAAQIGQYVYVFGGGWATYLNTVDRYDPVADSTGGTPWTTETSSTFGRRTIGATALGNDAYVVGGYSGGFRACVERGATDAPVYNDAALTRIEIPQNLGNYGVVMPPYISVTNLGPVRQYNIPVTLTIDSAGIQVYNRTGFANLDPAATGYAILPDWSACTTPGVVYTLKAWINWPLDQNAANDTSTVTAEIKDAIWYQYEVNSTGNAAQNFEAANDMYDCWLIHDFWISGPDSLWLDSIYVGGTYGGNPGPLDSIMFMIMPDSANGYPAFSTPLWTGYYTPANYTDSSGTIKVRFPQSVKVYGNNPGLWIAFQGQMNLSTGGQWYMNQTSSPVRGSYPGFWYNPGGGFGVGTGYTPTSSVWAGVTDHSFALFGGLTPTGVTGKPVETAKPAAFALLPSFPNPARSRATFSFSLPRAGNYSLKVYNLAGQLVHTIAGHGAAGTNRAAWNTGATSNGVYFYQLSAAGKTATGKLVIVR
jgi:hypothetical protein